MRLETSFPEDRIGDGVGFSGVHVLRVLQWIEDEDAIVHDATLSALLWKNVEAKLGRREDLVATRHRCRIVGYDTQEVGYVTLVLLMY